jgi:formate hydrogenlyase subunit 4
VNPSGLFAAAGSVLLAPLFLGVINRTKAAFAGRAGQPLVQVYLDLAKLAGKDAVYSRTTTWVFRLAPIASVAASISALLLLPQGGFPAFLAFPGDFVVLVFVLATSRFLTVIAALDTGSSFEGMGASREVAFSALAEPVLLLCLAVVAREAGRNSLSGIVGSVTAADWQHAGPALVLMAAGLLAILLAENARIPVDDPNTHLELTMIHEVMILDHGGPDLALLTCGAALKLWVLGALLTGLLLPGRTASGLLDALIFLASMLVLAVVIGVIESTIARLRLQRVPQFLVGAGAFAFMALALVMR